MMKKLTNISAFLLLLLPIFFVMLLAFTKENKNHAQEVSLKSENRAADGLKTLARIIK